MAWFLVTTSSSQDAMDISEQSDWILQKDKLPFKQRTRLNFGLHTNFMHLSVLPFSSRRQLLWMRLLSFGIALVIPKTNFEGVSHQIASREISFFQPSSIYFQRSSATCDRSGWNWLQFIRCIGRMSHRLRPVDRVTFGLSFIRFSKPCSGHSNVIWQSARNDSSNFKRNSFFSFKTCYEQPFCRFTKAKQTFYAF